MRKQCPPCHAECDEGRACAAAHESARALLSRLTLQQKDGGETVRDQLTFPLVVDRTEQMPERFRLKRDPLLSRLLAARFLFIVVLAVLAAAAQVFA